MFTTRAERTHLITIYLVFVFSFIDSPIGSTQTTRGAEVCKKKQICTRITVSVTCTVDVRDSIQKKNSCKVVKNLISRTAGSLV